MALIARVHDANSKLWNATDFLPRNRPTHNREGPAFQLLSDQVAYLKMLDFKPAEARNYIEKAANTKGMVVDLRGSTSWDAVASLGPLLIDKPIEFARFTSPSPSNPGAFYWSEPAVLNPAVPHYQGKIALVVDELTQGWAEVAAMAFRHAPGAVIIGSATAGAAADMAALQLPGGLLSSMSAFGVFHPDKTPTQRVGVAPDLASPGRDNALELAIRQILGLDR